METESAELGEMVAGYTWQKDKYVPRMKKYTVEDAIYHANGIANEEIPGDFGIELTWSERVALKYYVIETIQMVSRGIKEDYRLLAAHMFMRDYFGLDYADLEQNYASTGKKFTGSEGFKQYCRNHVDEWRAERTEVFGYQG